mmetsp:Transcript_107686/g.161108  ORF Transcript_107686/g.161108 Transcript_107686/m.161108 type:complete len:244 (+) Transcript_107686:273-1004(+)
MSLGTLSESRYDGFAATICIASFLPASFIVSSSALPTISTRAAAEPAFDPPTLPWTYEQRIPSSVVTFVAVAIPRFSRMATIASSNAVCTDLDSNSRPLTASSGIDPVVLLARVAPATCVTKSTNAELFPAKSVSELTFTNEADLPSSLTSHATKPSVASRPLTFFAAFAAPCSRSQSMALSTSPSVSPRAFLQSTMGAPDKERRSFKSAMDKEAKFLVDAKLAGMKFVARIFACDEYVIRPT